MFHHRLPLLSKSLAGLCLAIFVAGCHSKTDPAASARRFFEQVTVGKANEAYASAAFRFQSLQSEPVFEAICKEIGLTGASSVQISQPEMGNGTAQMNAEVTSAKGEKLNFIVTMALENRQWRLFSLKPPRVVDPDRREARFTLSAIGAGAPFNEALNQPMPNEKALKHLVSDALMEFNRAIQARSFATFYTYVSAAWQAQLTEKQLQRAFQGFIDNRVDISAIATLDPIFEAPPHLTSEGVLIVSGKYPTQPFQVYFSLKFIYELPMWKLFGIDISSDPSRTGREE
jgi:hypothetical protein